MLQRLRTVAPHGSHNWKPSYLPLRTSSCPISLFAVVAEFICDWHPAQVRPGYNVGLPSHWRIEPLHQVLLGLGLELCQAFLEREGLQVPRPQAASGLASASAFCPAGCIIFSMRSQLCRELVLASSAPLFSFIILDMKSLQLCFWLPESESKCQKSTLATAEGGEIHVWIKVWHFMFVAGLLNASKLISDVSSVQTPCSPAHQSSLSRILSCCGNVCRHELSVV